jgi:hypothetical protein
MHWVISGLDGSEDEIPVIELCAEELAIYIVATFNYISVFIHY